MYPTPEQHDALLSHCAHARFVWNLAVEQQSYYSKTRPWVPNSSARFRQLTEARAEFDWLRAGSVVVQQQALRDFDQAMSNFFGGTHRPPTFRRKGLHEGFRIVATGLQHIRQANRRWSEVFVPKVGWVRFRRSQAVPDFKSYRVTLDRAGRWHIAFAAMSEPIPAQGTGEVVGIDRGVAHALTLSTGEHLDFDTSTLDRRIRRMQRKLARAKRGSNRRNRLKARIATLHARRADARKDFVEKASTDIARRFDLIRIEDLKTKQMTRSARGTAEQQGTNVRAKAGLNRSILDKGWAAFASRLDQKAAGRVERVPAAYTSQRCSACSAVDANSRKSQAEFRCTACGFSANADVNAAINIAAGHAVTARGGTALAVPVNREPQLTPLSV
jgi:transposase